MSWMAGRPATETITTVVQDDRTKEMAMTYIAPAAYELGRADKLTLGGYGTHRDFESGHRRPFPW